MSELELATYQAAVIAHRDACLKARTARLAHEVTSSALTAATEETHDAEAALDKARTAYEASIR